MSYKYQSSDLDAVLKALGRASAASPHPPESSSMPTPPPQTFSVPESYPIQYPSQGRVNGPSQEAYVVANPSPIQPQSVPPTKPSTPLETQPPVTDPKTILTWKAALRHVTRLVSREPAVQERIRKMYRAQRDHEKQWWQGRETLLKQQAAREEGRKKLGELLKHVGGAVDASVGGPTPEEEATELKNYDRKVYRAFSDMHKDYQSQLAAMGIPFFNTRSALVVGGRGEGPGDRSSKGSGQMDVDRTEGETITEAELEALQKRMIGLLEDLCAD